MRVFILTGLIRFFNTVHLLYYNKIIMYFHPFRCSNLFPNKIYRRTNSKIYYIKQFIVGLKHIQFLGIIIKIKDMKKYE